jgi:hypothetical protein
MSAPKPPRHLVDRLLAEGERGITVSIVCLAAAMAVKRGGSTELTSIQCNVPVTDTMQARMREAHEALVATFREASAVELDHAIALYTAHLKAAGYRIGVSGKAN